MKKYLKNNQIYIRFALNVHTVVAFIRIHHREQSVLMHTTFLLTRRYCIPKITFYHHEESVHMLYPFVLWDVINIEASMGRYWEVSIFTFLFSFEYVCLQKTQWVLLQRSVKCGERDSQLVLRPTLTHKTSWCSWMEHIDTQTHTHTAFNANPSVANKWCWCAPQRVRQAKCLSHLSRYRGSQLSLFLLSCLDHSPTLL